MFCTSNLDTTTNHIFVDFYIQDRKKTTGRGSEKPITCDFNEKNFSLPLWNAVKVDEKAGLSQ